MFSLNIILPKFGSFLSFLQFHLPCTIITLPFPQPSSLWVSLCCSHPVLLPLDASPYFCCDSMLTAAALEPGKDPTQEFQNWNTNHCLNKSWTCLWCGALWHCTIAALILPLSITLVVPCSPQGTTGGEENAGGEGAARPPSSFRRKGEKSTLPLFCLGRKPLTAHP